jgi:hypothetical protein
MNNEEEDGSDDPDFPSSLTLSDEVVEAFRRETAERPEAVLHAIQMTMQATSGAYPPPAMMAEYKTVDPAINAQILAEAKLQAEHRRGLERLASERSENRLDMAQANQQWVAIASLVAAVLIFGLSFWIQRKVSWPVATAALLIAGIGIGGRPAATVLTTYIANRFSQHE